MNIVIQGCTVTNWSKEPLLTLSHNQQAKLGQAIQCSRQMTSDALHRMKNYRHRLLVKSIDPQMAKDFFQSGTDVKEALEKYFGITTASPGFGTDFDTIIGKIELTDAGLQQPFDIVVGHIHDWDDVKEGVSDFFSEFKKFRLRSAFSALGSIRTGTRGWVSPGHALKRIHLNVDIINSDPRGKIARTIVHEGTHKWANTDDVAYKWENLPHNAGGYANLTNNADSYAWTCRRIWKRVRHMPAGS